MVSLLNGAAGTATDGIIEGLSRPTQADATTLAIIYKVLDVATKNHNKAISEYRKALATWDGTTSAPNAGEVEATGTALTDALLSGRRDINTLPAGTTAKSGATRQSVVLQFYGPCNRDLGKRLTAADARKVNQASFG